MLKRLLIAACTLLFAGSLLAATPAAKPHVLIATSLGEIEVELDPTKAPISVKNFLEYVDSGYYDGTLFHRVIPGFMVQTGGFSAGMQEKKTRAPIKNEADNGLLNERGTLAMARTGVVDSATSQFFINLTDNDSSTMAPATSAMRCSARWCVAWAWSTRSPRFPPPAATASPTCRATTW